METCCLKVQHDSPNSTAIKVSERLKNQTGTRIFFLGTILLKRSFCVYLIIRVFSASIPFSLMNSVCLLPQGKLVTRNFLSNFQLEDFTTAEPLQHSDKQAYERVSGELKLCFFTIELSK